MKVVASGTRKKITRSDGSKQQYFSSTTWPMDKKGSKQKLPLLCQPKISRQFETDVSEKYRLILTNRFSVLGNDASLDDNNNDRLHADNVELRYNTTNSIPHTSIKSNSNKTIRNFKKTAHTYSTICKSSTSIKGPNICLRGNLQGIRINPYMKKILNLLGKPTMIFNLFWIHMLVLFI